MAAVQPQVFMAVMVFDSSFVLLCFSGTLTGLTEKARGFKRGWAGKGGCGGFKGAYLSRVKWLALVLLLVLVLLFVGETDGIEWGLCQVG